MEEKKYVGVKTRTLRDIDNLKNALQMFGALVWNINTDEIDDTAMDEGELVKALCRKVVADIDEVLSYSK